MAILSRSIDLISASNHSNESCWFVSILLDQSYFAWIETRLTYWSMEEENTSLLVSITRALASVDRMEHSSDL